MVCLHAAVLVLLALAITGYMWQLVHAAPAVLARVLPRGLTVGVGGGLFVLGWWSAFLNANVTHEPSRLLFALLRVYVGLWFMLAPSADSRGSESDERFLRRLFGMIAIVMAALIGALYVNDAQIATVLQLLMITGGFWVTMNYLRLTDRGG